MSKVRHIFSAASDSDAALSPHPAMRLVLYVVVLLSCAALFCGGTFAWFTDSASCSVEPIQIASDFKTAGEATDDGADKPALTSDASTSQSAAGQNAAGQDASALAPSDAPAAPSDASGGSSAAGAPDGSGAANDAVQDSSAASEPSSASLLDEE